MEYQETWSKEERLAFQNIDWKAVWKNYEENERLEYKEIFYLEDL